MYKTGPFLVPQLGPRWTLFWTLFWNTFNVVITNLGSTRWSLGGPKGGPKGAKKGPKPQERKWVTVVEYPQSITCHPQTYIRCAVLGPKVTQYAQVGWRPKTGPRALIPEHEIPVLHTLSLLVHLFCTGWSKERTPSLCCMVLWRI